MIVAADEGSLAEVVDALRGRERIGLDAEGNGLYVYRAQLCVLQFAWEDESGIQAAVVDPLAVDIAPLAPLLDASGPIKVLHDLTFDARLLVERGIRLGNVRDTSVAAQLLGEPKIGLATLVQGHLGVAMHKALQDHDWGVRPLEAHHLTYLAEDVRHLLPLERALAHAVSERGIVEEVAVECGYKLRTALEPPRDRRPAHARIKGYRELPARGRALLRRLSEARERLAEAEDVPPFRIAPSGLLLEMARRAPRDRSAVDRICRHRVAVNHLASWHAAVALGMSDDPREESDDAPPAKPAPTPHEINLQKRVRKALAEWRRSEAETRAVTLQVVIPGHCVEDVCAVVAAGGGDAAAVERGLAAIDGFGDGRAARYASVLAAFGVEGG